MGRQQTRRPTDTRAASSRSLRESSAALFLAILLLVSARAGAQEALPVEPRELRTGVSEGTAFLARMQEANREIARKVLPSIVNVSTERETSTSEILPFGHPFFDDVMPDTYQTRSLGSGIIFDAGKGYILTNHHVVHEADQIVVTIRQNGIDRTVSTEIIGLDEQSELAILQIDREELASLHLQEAVLGDSDGVQVGDYVYAVGNPFGYSQTFNMGIITGISRWWQERPRIGFMQTDASVNPGNSGGALVNIYGEVVGINTFIASTSGGSEGIGFAIPVNDAKLVIPQLVARGYVTYGFLGVYPVALEDVEEEGGAGFLPSEGLGAWIRTVQQDSPADLAGLREQDTILRLGDLEVNTPHDLFLAVKTIPIGEEVEVEVWRPYDGRKTFRVRIAALEERTLIADVAESVIGLTLEEVEPEGTSPHRQFGPREVRVSAVEPGSLAAEAGIREGDVITGVGQEPVRNLESFRNAFVQRREQIEAGMARRPEILFSLRRGELDLFKTIKLE